MVYKVVKRDKTNWGGIGKQFFLAPIRKNAVKKAKKKLKKTKIYSERKEKEIKKKKKRLKNSGGVSKEPREIMRLIEKAKKSVAVDTTEQQQIEIKLVAAVNIQSEWIKWRIGINKPKILNKMAEIFSIILI